MPTSRTYVCQFNSGGVFFALTLKTQLHDFVNCVTILAFISLNFVLEVTITV